ncbi:MAG: hypothetical protein KF718_16850 [Polyangiaceae bacterium]|nr:hypothetical protein [Polyangiaceae bacterium]
MTDWREFSDGWRTWTQVDTLARWRYVAGGDIEAMSSSGKELDLSPDALPDNYLSTAKKRVPEFAQQIHSVTGDAFYTRALLAIGLHETGFRPLPMFGDCRDKNDKKKVVPCWAANAAPPLSVGWYQFLRSTAKSLGASWDELASSPTANHKAALTLAMKWAPHTGKDFPALAARWNAGSIRPDATKDWGVVTWAANTLTRYARCWNAIGHVLRSGIGVSQGTAAGGELDVVGAGALLVICWTLLE